MRCLLLAPPLVGIAAALALTFLIGGHGLAVALVGVGGLAVGLLAANWRLARLSGRLAALTRRCDALADRHKREMALAAEVHNSIIPASMKVGPFLIDIRYQPLEAVGGDIVNLSVAEADGVARVSVGDVTGHGVAAALLVNRVHHEAEGLLAQRLPPEDVLRRVNALVWRTFQDTGMFMTFATIEVDLAARRVRWANAAHPPALHWRAATGAVTLLEPQTTPLGLDEEVLIDFEPQSEPFAPGDRIILHTDGLIDALDPAGRRFGMDRLIALAGEVGGHEPDRIAAEIIQRVQRHTRGPAQDDVLVVTLAVSAAPEG